MLFLLGSLLINRSDLCFNDSNAIPLGLYLYSEDAGWNVA